MGTGFRPGKLIELELGRTHLRAVRADANGHFKRRFTVPRGASLGGKRLLASDGKRSVANRFAVTRKKPAASSSMTAHARGHRFRLSPTTGTEGSRVAVRGFGFPARSDVSLFFAGAFLDTLGANAHGRLSGSFTVPADVAGLRAVALRSARPSLTAPFRARPAPPPPGPGVCSEKGAAAADEAADQVHLAWVEDAARTLTVVWRTRASGAPSLLEYRRKGSDAWLPAEGGKRSSGTAGTLHQVTLRGLAPASAYEYRVRGDDGVCSAVFSTRTAPLPGGKFDFVYVPDTGLIGRKDGLATGTEQVRDEIAELAPTLVLGGGDYAYFDTDKRFGTIEATIDAWFDQMQPIAARAPLMPTYGNHEVVLDGDFFANWAARFPTPAGFGERRYYSFDVGDAHFTSILAYQNQQGLKQAALDWIDQDLAAAEARGMRWLIPFMHVPSFGDGQNHKQNTALRAQLAPLFEKHGVTLAITSHDQAYERSYPLTNATATGYEITSTDPSCYTLADGVVWVKVSPGGKLSNISDDFSPFLNETAPDWTASRNNTSHHVVHVEVSATKLELSDFQVKGDGSPPVIGDSFRVTSGACS